MTEHGPYAQAADAYWRAGWHGVLPLPPKKKTYPPKGYTGGNGAFPSYADIFTWIEDKADGNIAMRLPANIIGIDVDAYGDKAGANTLAITESMYGTLPRSWRTTSRDDGISGIRLYRVPEGLAWPGELAGGGVEIIQIGHRYAVVWPSIHPDTGGRYRWISPDGVVSTVIPDPDELPWLPTEWVEGITGGIEKVDVVRNNFEHNDALAWIAATDGASKQPCTRMRKALDVAVHDLADGDAHDTARDAALRVVRLGHEHHRGALVALGEVRKAFIANATNPNRMLQKKTRRTPEEAAYEWSELVASAVGLVSANPTGMTTCDCDGQLTGMVVSSTHTPEPATDGATALAPETEPAEQEPTEQEPTEPVDNPLDAELRKRISDGEKFLLEVPEKVPTIWGDGEDVIWAEGEALMIVGPPGVGKTTLTAQILRGLLGLQGEVLEVPVEPAKRVLYLAMDRPAQIRRALARSFHRGEADTLREKVEFWQGPPPGDIAKHPDVLVTLAELTAADVIIIDSLKDAAVGLVEDEVAASYNRARQKALAAGIQVLELHHMVKRGAGGNKPTELADVYGSAWLTAGAGSVLLLWGAAGDPIVQMNHLKQPMGEFGPLKLQHDHSAGRTTVFHGTDILAVVGSAGAGGVSPTDIARQLFETEKPSASEKEKARRRLDKLADQGLVESYEKGRDVWSGGRPQTYYRLPSNPNHDPNHANHATHLSTGNHVPTTPTTQNDVFAGQANHDPNHANHATQSPIPTTPVPPYEIGGREVGAENALEILNCGVCGTDVERTELEALAGVCMDCRKNRRR